MSIVEPFPLDTYCDIVVTSSIRHVYDYNTHARTTLEQRGSVFIALALLFAGTGESALPW